MALKLNEVESASKYYDEALNVCKGNGGTIFVRDLLNNLFSENRRIKVSNDNQSDQDTIISHKALDKVKTIILISDNLLDHKLSCLFVDQGIEWPGFDDNWLKTSNFKEYYSGNSNDLYNSILRTSISKEYRELFGYIDDVKPTVYFNVKDNALTLTPTPGKTMEVAELSFNISTSKLNGISKAIYQYILVRDDDNFEEIVNKTKRSLLTKMKNKYKKYVDVTNHISMNEISNGSKLPCELTPEEISRNPRYLFTGSYSDTEVLAELGKLYDNDPSRFFNMIYVKRAFDTEEIRIFGEYVNSKVNDCNWFESAFGLDNIHNLFEKYTDQYTSLIKKWDLIKHFTKDQKKNILLSYIDSLPTDKEFINKGLYENTNVLNFISEILNDNDLIEIVDKHDPMLCTSYYTNGFTYLGYKYCSIDDEFRNIIEFINNTNRSLYIIKNEPNYNMIKSLPDVLKLNYSEKSKNIGIKKTYDELVDTIEKRVFYFKSCDKINPDLLKDNWFRYPALKLSN